jgi:hypothetical protein
VSTLKPSDAGYRGALPPRNDWLARGWVLAVIAIFAGMFVLAALNVPTVLFPEPTPIATPAPSGSLPPSGSAEPSASGSVAPSASPTP